VVDGVWLSYVMLGAALVCMVGLYTSVALTAEISLQVSARPPPTEGGNHRTHRDRNRSGD
jgi:hypothetical protein